MWMSSRSPRASLVASLAMAAALALSACAAGAPSRQTTAQSTNTPRLSAWTVVSGAAVAQAPVAIRTTYKVSDGAQGVIQRSDDAGSTWRALPWPRIAGVHLPADVAVAYGVWNAHAPNTLFVPMDLANDANCPATSAIAIPPDFGANPPTSSTGKLCALTYMTSDNGATWRALTFSGGSGWTMNMFMDFNPSSTSGTPVAEGSRLFALFTPTQWQPNLYTGEDTPSPSHLFASDDGGSSWRLADTAITTAGQRVQSVLAAPAGQALFALTEPQETPAKRIASVYHIWTSQDGGATWTRGGTIPGGRMDGLIVAYSPQRSAPVLYALIDTQTDNDLHIYASADGARTWPYALDLHMQETGGAVAPWLLGALPDGGVAIFDNAGQGGRQPDPSSTTDLGAISEWRYDMTSARTLTDYSNLTNLSAVAIQPAASGGVTIWLSGYRPTESQLVTEYATIP